MELQLERDERGEQWLTCFLLPQQGQEPPYDEGTVGLCVCVYGRSDTNL